MALGCGGAGRWLGELWSDRAPKIERLELDAFEAPRDDRYGTLDHDLPPDARGKLEWSRTGCRRSARDGQCLHLRYELPDVPRARATFAIDLGDLDASSYDHLELWIRGDGPNGEAPDLKVGFRRPKDGERDLVEDGTTVVRGIAGGWRQVVIPLNKLSGIQKWDHLRHVFFAIDSRRAKDVRRGGYWIDDVSLLRTGTFGPTILDPVLPKQKRAWTRSIGDEGAVRAAVRERLSGWPSRLLVDRAELPKTDHEFLERLARDTWRGLADLTDRENGLPLDHVILSRKSLEPADVRIGDYTNITNVGLHLITVVAARDLGIISTGEARDRLAKLFDTLDRMETHEGFFFNYYDTVTLERTSNFISFVDSSWLTAGLMIVRRAVPELRDRATALLEREDYEFFYDDVPQQMSHGYYVNVQARSEYHYGVLYTEARLGSLIAVGKGDAPEAHWFALVRAFPPQAEWQVQRPTDWRVRLVRGHEVELGTYEWKGYRYVPSWGGSMFEALMPALVLDEQKHAPKSLGRNGQIHAEVQKRFAEEELGYPVWGMSPAANPNEAGYGEYGARPLGTLGYGGGAVAPYAAALALPLLPKETAANLRRLAEKYDAYGEYGFYDSVDPVSGNVAYSYLALDQSMVLIALANHLRDHAIQRHFAADPIAKRAIRVIREESFFD